MRGIETIDCHTHVGRLVPGEGCERILLSELDRAGVSLALVSNIEGARTAGKASPPDAAAVNRATARLVRQYPDRFRALFWARPGANEPDELAELLEARLSPEEASPWTDRVFVGVELHPDPRTCPADDGRMDPFMDLARQHRVPVVLHWDHGLDEASIRSVHALAARHPDLPIVLYHMGSSLNGAGRSGGPGVDVASSVLGSGSADMYLETSGAPVETVLEALRSLGAERVLFGTDAACFGEGHYEHYRALGAALAGTLDDGELSHVMARNARHLFRLSGASCA